VFEDEFMDHFAVCSSTRSFKSIYTFLHDGKREPPYEQVQCGEPLVIEGKAVSFGDNERIAGGRIEVYELGADPRERGAPVASLPVQEDGTVGPWQAKRGVRYEWKQLPADGDERAPRYSYFQPFTRGDGLVRFLYESKGASELPSSQRANLSDATAAMVVRHKQGAFLFGRDQLLVHGTETLSEESAMMRATVVGLYVLDQDGDGQSGGGSVLRATFVNGTDLFLPTDPPAFIDVDFNGVTLQVPNWPSKTGGLSMVWFD
jgi:Lipase C-terminal domain